MEIKTTRLMPVESRLETIHRPKAVLDLRGLIMHAYHGSRDPDAILAADGRTLVKRASFGLFAFSERYLAPLFEKFAPIDVVCVKEGGNDIRRAIYPEYKAKRAKEKEAQDPRLTEQLSLLISGVEKLMANLGCTMIEVPKVEADDVIAMICHRYPGNVLVHTRDADLAPLACLPNTVVMLSENLVEPEEPITLDGLQVLPRHVTLYKALVGDSSDEYPGVKGVGPAAWQYLVKTYEDEGLAEIEKAIMDDNRAEVLEAANQYGDKVLRKMVEQWEQLRMCYRLATLHPNWCWMARGGTLLRPKYTKRLPLPAAVRQTLDEMGCSALYEDFKPYLATETLVDSNWLTEDRMETLKDRFEGSPAIGFDTEGYDKNMFQNFRLPTTGKANFVDTLSQELTGASFTFGRNLQHSIYVPVDHADTANVDKGRLAELLSFSTDKAKKLLIAHNSRFEQQIIERCLGLDICDWEDSITWLSYFDESMMEGHNGGGGLKECSSAILHYQQQSYADTLAAASASNMREISGSQVLHYGCDDALVSAHLWVLFTFACALEGQSRFVEENDILSGRALNRSHLTGINIDLGELAKQAAEDRELVEKTVAELRALLEQHAMGVSEEEANRRAVKFFEADREFREMTLRTKMQGVGAEKLKAELEVQRLKLREQVNYVPLQEVRRPVSFSPTPKQLTQVATLLGLPEVPENALEKDSGKQIKLWLIRLHDLVYNSDTEFEPEIEEFLQLLGAASMVLKKAEEPASQALSAFCTKVLEPHAKVDLIGDELNFDSPNQMQALLYLKLGLPVRRRSKVDRGSTRDKWRCGGSPATDEKAISLAIAEDCPEGDWRRDFLKALLKMRKAATRIELFWTPYPDWIRPDTGMLHGQIKNNGTVTRRPTGGSPNLLAVSKGPVRRIVIPRFNKQVIISIDFSGQELRITGSEAKDPAFIEAYTGGGTYQDEYGMTRQNVKDVHSVTGVMFAMEVLKRELSSAQLDALELDEFSRMSYEQFRAIVTAGVAALSHLKLSEDDAKAVVSAVEKVRKMAKAVNFLICYLGQPSTLAGNLGIPVAFAERIMAQVFESYGRLAPWQAETIKFARTHGYVTTAYGTWKHVSSDILSKDGGKRSRAERQAVNQTIQGCAADILKCVLTSAEERKVFHDPRKAVMHAPIYDEIMASVHMDYAFEYCQVMQDIMNVTPPGHAIPMMGEVSIGMNWCDQVELGDRPAERKIIELFESWAKEAA